MWQYYNHFYNDPKTVKSVTSDINIDGTTYKMFYNFCKKLDNEYIKGLAQ